MNWIEIWQYVLCVAGIIIGGILSLAVLAGFWAYAMDSLRWLSEHHDEKVRAACMRDLGDACMHGAYWFSESAEAMAIIKSLGETLRESPTPYVGMDQWRAKYRAQKAEAHDE